MKYLILICVVVMGCTSPTEPREVAKACAFSKHPLVRPDVSAIDTTQIGCKQCHDFRMRIH